MKFLILMSLLLEICSGAKLGINYLPPNREGLGLSVPRPGGNGRPNGNGGPQLTPQRKRASGNSNGDAKNAEKSVHGPVYTTFDGSNGGGAGAGGESVPILSYENINNGNGNYKFSYETGNGIKVEEEGKLKNAGTDNEIQSAVGSFSYTAPDGQEIKIEYSADESGFVPKGNHLLTPPPIPEEILKSLEQNAGEEAIGNGRNDGNGGGGENGYRY